MSYRPLSRRIIVAFTLVVAIVSGLFSVGIISAVRYVEKQLIANDLHGDLAIAIADLHAGRDIDLKPGTRFFYDDSENTDSNTYDPPDWLKDLNGGVHEVFRDQQSYHALVYKQGKDEFMLLQDQTDFEKREHVLFIVVIAGFLSSVGMAWLLGHLLAKRVLEPVIRLAKEVGHRDQLQMQAPPLAPDYADDEIGKLAEAFDSTIGELRAALNREQFFTNDVSHELRTPLMVITSSCELLAAADNLSPRQQEQLARISRACAEMRDLVKTFLLLARDSLHRDAHVDLATLPAIANEQCQQWRAAAEAKGLSLNLDVVHSDASNYNAPLLRAVLANLLRNAVHYTDSGFVKVVVDGKSVRVEDSGLGIEEAQRETVFKPFVRGTQARGEGLGLGLSLVKRICAHENWGITLHAREPQGSCFEVTLSGNTH